MKFDNTKVFCGNGKIWEFLGFLWKKMGIMEKNGNFCTQIKVNKLNGGKLRFDAFCQCCAEASQKQDFDAQEGM